MNFVRDLKMTFANDNSRVLRQRHVVANTFLEQEERALSNTRQLLRGCILPIGDYMPGAHILEEISVNEGMLSKFDMNAAVKLVRNDLVLSKIYEYLENRISVNAQMRDVLDAKSSATPSSIYTGIVSTSHALFEEYLENRGVAPSSSAETFVFTQAVLHPNIAYEGALDKLSDSLFKTVQRDILLALESRWADLAQPVNKTPETTAWLEQFGVPEVFKKAARHITEDMVDGLGSAVVALQQWHEVDTALEKWKGWRAKIQVLRV